MEFNNLNFKIKNLVDQNLKKMNCTALQLKTKSCGSVFWTLDLYP